MMVDDDDVGIGGFAAHLEDEAAIVVRALLRRARVRLHDPRAAWGGRPLNLLGHRDLRRTRLVGGQGPLEASLEKFGERGHSSLFTPRAALEARERRKG